MCSVKDCDNSNFDNEDRCSLHCEKTNYQKDRCSKLLSNFYNNFIDYIIEEIFEDTDLLNEKFSKEEIKIYFQNNKLDNGGYNSVLKQILFIPSYIYFPTRDGRDSFDYLKILNLFGKIHFNYCEFYLSHLNLNNIKCFFQDCKFHNRWTLYNYNILKNEDNVIYQTCEFNKTISNYTPEKSTKLAVYRHSQFDYTCTFNDSIKFDRVKFKDTLFNTNQYNYLEENTIKELKFEYCTFEKKFKLNNYKIDEFICNDSIFEDKFEFKDNIIKVFEVNNSNFNKIVDLCVSKFKRFCIKRSVFENFVGFGKCTFGTSEKLNKELTLFKYVTFKDLVNFRDTKFLSGLDIKNINLQGGANFLDTQIELDNTPRETFRIIKNSFDDMGNIIEANKFYYKEMQKREEELKNNRSKDFFEWIVFKIHDISSNHSQNWLLPLYWIIIITFISSHIKEFFSQNNTEYYIIPLILNIIIMIYIFLEINILKALTISYKIISIVGIYLIYSFATNDIILENFTHLLNPFGKIGQDITFGLLIYKIVITYLIYQFIISIRQNTRRK